MVGADTVGVEVRKKLIQSLQNFFMPLIHKLKMCSDIKCAPLESHISNASKIF